MTNPMVSAASRPPLQKTQERGTHGFKRGKEKSDGKGWATRAGSFLDSGRDFVESLFQFILIAKEIPLSLFFAFEV